MPIRTAANIHRLRHDPAAPTLVATELEYRQSHARALIDLGIPMSISTDQPAPYVEGWKWVVTCTTISCSNRPMFGWGIACCYDCGFVYEGLVLPDDAAEIERLLEQRPKLSQRSWLLTETLDDLIAQNLSIGVGI